LNFAYSNHSLINLYQGQPKHNKTKAQKSELTTNQIHIKKAKFHSKRKNVPLLGEIKIKKSKWKNNKSRKRKTNFFLLTLLFSAIY